MKGKRAQNLLIISQCITDTKGAPNPAGYPVGSSFCGSGLDPDLAESKVYGSGSSRI